MAPHSSIPAFMEHLPGPGFRTLNGQSPEAHINHCTIPLRTPPSPTTHARSAVRRGLVVEQARHAAILQAQGTCYFICRTHDFARTLPPSAGVRYFFDAEIGAQCRSVRFTDSTGQTNSGPLLMSLLSCGFL